MSNPRSKTALTFTFAFVLAATAGGFVYFTRNADRSGETRKPASGNCSNCDELRKLRGQMSALPRSDSERRSSKKRAAMEENEALILKSGGMKIASLYKDRTPDTAEIRAAAEFLVLTVDRDPVGIALDWITSTLDGRASAALSDIESAAKDLESEKALSRARVNEFLSRLRILREENTAGQG